MQNVSARFLAALRDSHVVKTTVDVWYQNAVAVSDLPVVDGSITVDRTSKVRRQGSLTIGDPTFFPTFANSPLAPYGAELNIKQGILYPDGSNEVISLGWFRIDTVTRDVAAGSSSTGPLPVVTFVDRAQVIEDYGFLDPLDRGGWLAKDLLTHLINDILSNVTVIYDPSLSTSGVRVPGGTIFDQSRWDAVELGAGCFGAEAYFDTDGNVQVVPIPALTQSTPASASVWNFDASTDAAVNAGASKQGVLVSAQQSVSRAGVYNYVACYGTAAGSNAPPVGYAYDNDSRSPTYVNGPYGRASYRYTNNLVTTQAQANTAAQAQLNNFLGQARSLSFQVLPNPALEAGDIIQAIYPDGKKELHILDSFVIPMGPSAQFTGTTRTLTYQASGGT